MTRSADWPKWRASRGQEFLIGGSVPNGNLLDSILVGYYIGRDLMYAGAVQHIIRVPSGPVASLRGPAR